ncbi:MAG TPA: hypothetical protein VL357_07835 [Rariglobus sp.]|nr:hypothetical protein [Rariglobus sp.]
MLKTLMCLVCFTAILALSWMLFLPGLLTSVIEKRTGFITRVDSIYANPFKGEINLRGLVMVNPAGFRHAEFLDLRQFTAKADLLSLFGDHPVINMSTIDVARVTVVTNAQGVNNVDLLSRRLAWLPDKKAKAKTPAAEDSPIKFLIKHLDVKLGEVVVVNDSGATPSEHATALNFEHSYSDITSGSKFLAETAPSLNGTTLATLLPGDTGRALDEATQRAMPRQTYAFRRAGEKDSGTMPALEEKPKP